MWILRHLQNKVLLSSKSWDLGFTELASEPCHQLLRRHFCICSSSCKMKMAMLPKLTDGQFAKCLCSKGGKIVLASARYYSPGFCDLSVAGGVDTTLLWRGSAQLGARAAQPNGVREGSFLIHLENECFYLGYMYFGYLFEDCFETWNVRRFWGVLMIRRGHWC